MRDEIRKGANDRLFKLRVDNFIVRDTQSGEVYEFVPDMAIFLISDDELVTSVYQNAGKEITDRVQPEEWTSEFSEAVLETLIEYGHNELGVDKYGHVPNDARAIAQSRFEPDIVGEVFSEKSVDAGGIDGEIKRLY